MVRGDRFQHAKNPRHSGRYELVDGHVVLPDKFPQPLVQRVWHTNAHRTHDMPPGSVRNSAGLTARMPKRSLPAKSLTSSAIPMADRSLANRQRKIVHHQAWRDAGLSPRAYSHAWKARIVRTEACSRYFLVLPPVSKTNPLAPKQAPFCSAPRQSAI